MSSGNSVYSSVTFIIQLDVLPKVTQLARQRAAKSFRFDSVMEVTTSVPPHTCTRQMQLHARVLSLAKTRFNQQFNTLLKSNNKIFILRFFTIYLNFCPMPNFS